MGEGSLKLKEITKNMREQFWRKMQEGARHEVGKRGSNESLLFKN